MEDKFGALVCGSKEMGRRQIEIESGRMHMVAKGPELLNYKAGVAEFFIFFFFHGTYSFTIIYIIMSL